MSTDLSTATDDRSVPIRSRTWSVATVISIVLGLAAASVMTAAMFWIGNYYRGSRISRDAEGRQKLLELRAVEENELETYGWINQADGVVRIPVEQAMQLLAKEAQRQEPLKTPPRDEQPTAK